VVLRAMPGHGDWLVCGISTQLAQRINGFDELLDSQDPDYEMSGVVQPSLIRLGFLGVLPPHRVLGCIGAVSSDTAPPRAAVGRGSARWCGSTLSEAPPQTLEALNRFVDVGLDQAR